MRRLHFSLWLLGLALLCLGGPVHAGDETPIRAGFASVDLTPELPVPMGGYGSLVPRMAKSVHDPIQAHACVLQQDGRRVALVSIDTVGVSARMTADLVRATRDLDLPILLAATHTHASLGGLTRVPLWRPMMGPFDQELYERTRDKLIACVRAAFDDCKPARLSYAQREIDGFNRNRRVKGGPVDKRLRVLQIHGANGAVRGMVVGFAAHPTLLDDKNKALSAGWPGAMRRALKPSYPDATVLFFNGAMGDVSARPQGGDNPFERVEAFGRALAEQVVALAGQAKPMKPELQASMRTVELRSVAARLLGDDEATGLGLRSPLRLPVMRLTLARKLALVTTPGEPTVQSGRYIEGWSDSGYRKTWVVSCAQDHVGYFADPKTLYRGGYEADMSFCGPQAASRIGGAVSDLHNAVDVSAPTEPSVGSHGLPHFVSHQPSSLVLHHQEDPDIDLGRQHGYTLRSEIVDLLEQAEPALIAHAKKAGIDRVTGPLSIASGGAVKPDDLIIPLLCRAARTLQPHIPEQYLLEMEGVAQGANVPYDAILLLNCFLTLAEQTDPTAMLKLPVRCTNVVAFGDATCMGQMLHGSTLDWGMGEVLRSRARVMVFQPAGGIPFVSVGWPGMVGTLRAMNAAGIAITEESCAAPDDTRLNGMPLPFVMRKAIERSRTLQQAVSTVKKARGTCGYKVTISDGRRMDARTVAVTATKHHVRMPKDGLLFGVEPDATPDRFEWRTSVAGIPRSDASSLVRYAALRTSLASSAQCLRRSLLSWALSQRGGRILNDNTLLACLFEPGLLRFHVALGDDVPVNDPDEVLSWKTYSLPELLGKTWRDHDPLCRECEIEPVWEDQKELLGTRRANVSFDSPHPSGRAFNDRVKAEVWFPKGDPKGFVIHLPAWKERTLAAHRFLALNLARRGMATVILPLPYQHGRTAKGERPGQRTLSPNLAQTRQAMIQGLAEIRALGLHLKERYEKPLAISGVSLGGHVAAVAYGAYPELFEGGAFVLTGGNVIEAFLKPNSVTGKIQKELARRGVTLDEASELVKDFEPLTRVDPKRGKGVLIVAADEDDVVPPARARALSKAYGDAKIVWLDGGHYAPIRPDQAVRLVKAVGEHLANVFGGE